MRVGHPVVVAMVGGVVLAVLGGLGSRDAGAVDPGEIEIYDAVPAESTVRMGVGERKQFSVWARGEGLVYQWLVDGGSVGDRHSWTFVPRQTDVGSHLVTVAIDGPDGRLSRSWRVLVEVTPPGAFPSLTPSTSPPAAPPPPTTRVPDEPTTSTSTSSTAPETTLRPTSTTSSTREPTTSSTRLPTTTTTRRPTTTTSVRPTTSSTARPTTTSSAPPPPPTTLARTTTTVPPRVGTVTDGEVRALFERYKAAWRSHDIAALESVGQVATQGQADALKAYFESVQDLEVDVTILGIAITGDEASVRFIRRDRFRDPGGSMVTKESPVIEKRVVRTPGGLRLAPPR